MFDEISTSSIVLTIAITIAAIIVLAVSAAISNRKAKKSEQSQITDTKPAAADRSVKADKPQVDSETLEKLKIAKLNALRASAYSDYYNEKFRAVAEPIQWLLGVAADSSINTERSADYIDQAVNKIKAALGKDYRVSQPRINDMPVGFMDTAAKGSRDDVLRKIENLNLDADVKAFSYKKILELMSSIMPEIEAVTVNKNIDRPNYERLANKLSNILSDNGIYPLDESTNGIAGRQDLNVWFSKANTDALKYPALFSKREGVYELLDNYRGKS
jgi:hypothetical protein